MTFRTIGMIIAKRDGRDADRIYTIYTKDHGKIVALAKSARKITSKLAGHLDLCTIATFTIARGRVGDHIATVDVIQRALPSLEHSDRLIAVLYCLECTDQLLRSGHVDEDVYELLLNFVREMIQGSFTASHGARAYLYNLCSLLGYGVPAEQFSVQDHVFPHLYTMPKSQVYFEHLTSGTK